MNFVCLHVFFFFFNSVVENEDPLARGLYIPCPDHYKNYCVHGECQYPRIPAQPSCRYTHTITHTHTVWLYLLAQGTGRDKCYQTNISARTRPPIALFMTGWPIKMFYRLSVIFFLLTVQPPFYMNSHINQDLISLQLLSWSSVDFLLKVYPLLSCFTFHFLPLCVCSCPLFFRVHLSFIRSLAHVYLSASLVVPLFGPVFLICSP